MNRLHNVTGRMFSVVLLLGMVCFNGAGNLAEAAPVTIISFSPSVEVCAIDGKNCQVMTKTTELKQGQEVRIFGGGSLAIRLEDGSTISLKGPKTLLIKALSDSDLDIQILRSSAQAAQERKGTPPSVKKQNQHGSAPSSPQP